MPRTRVLSADLVGWKEIAAELRASVSTVQSWAARSDDPLPVRRFNGRVQARSEELKSWVERQERRVA